jgi:HEPN domain-containing protein
MPPERFSAEDPREWLKRAKSNLVQAQKTDPDVYLEDLCFQAQQAAEKALKALILQERGNFPYVHNVAQLLGVLDEMGIELPSDIKQTAQLTDYAVEARYPGPFEPVTREEYDAALCLARKTIEWVEGQLK